MTWPLKAAASCGLIPLLAGTVIYVTWRVTRWTWLETAGIYCLFGGFVLVLLGFVILGGNWWQERRRRSSLPIIQWQSIMIGGLLLLNFLAAGFFTFSAIGIRTRYTVHVINETGVPVERFLLNGPGISAELGPIAAGQQTQRHLSFSGDGPLVFTGVQGTNQISGEVEGYVTAGMGGDVMIQLLPGLNYQLHRREG